MIDLMSFDELRNLVEEYHAKFFLLDQRVVSDRKNSQNRSIRQIIGHMIDSASNNTHRIVQLQYRESPLQFHNYATEGNNDRWINIQNYQNEDWLTLVNLWKYSHLHICHVVEQIDMEIISSRWEAESGTFVTLEEMVNDFPRHFKLHISEINELLSNSNA